MDQFSFKHSCHSLTLKDSTVVLPVGVSGREKSTLILLSYTHLSSIFPANLEPLSVFSNCGKGCLSAMLFSISATSVERILCPTLMLRHSLVYRSITVSRSSCCPLNRASATKSIPQRWLRYKPLSCGRRRYADLLRRGRLRRSESPCS